MPFTLYLEGYSPGVGNLTLTYEYEGKITCSDFVKMTAVRVEVSADIDMNGQIDDGDLPLKSSADHPGLLVPVNDRVHETPEGMKVNHTDDIITGAEDRANMRVIRLQILGAPEGAKALLTCSDSAAVRIFDKEDTAIIGPGAGGQYEIESESVFSVGVEYLIEGVSGGKELSLSLTCRNDTGKMIGTNSMKVSTVGMSVVSGASTGSIHRVVVQNVKGLYDTPSDTWLGYTKTLPAYVVMRLKSGVEITELLHSKLCRPLDIYGNDWEGDYFILNEQGERAWPMDHAIMREDDTRSLWYTLYLGLWIMNGYPPDTEEIWDFMYMFMGLNPADRPYYWELPPQGEVGTREYRIVERENEATVRDMDVTLLKEMKIPLGGEAYLNNIKIGKVYVPTKWGGSNTLSGADMKLYYTDGSDLDGETAIKIFTGELENKLVASGDPCKYDVPVNKHGWYYVKVPNESDVTVSSLFYEHGCAATIPWQGYYWAFSSSFPPNLYQDGYALDKYDQVYGTASQAWEAEHHAEDIQAYGHCWGTAVASVLLEQPQATTKNGINFTEDDMEALYIELAAFCEGLAEPGFVLADIPASPVTFAANEEVDAYCGKFHKIISEVLSGEKDPLVGNLRTQNPQGNPEEVHNHAVYKYSSQMVEMEDGDNEKLIRVYTKLWAVANDQYPSTSFSTRTDVHSYDIEFNVNGVVDTTGYKNWRSSQAFPPFSIYWIEASQWMSENPEVTKENVESLYND